MDVQTKQEAPAEPSEVHAVAGSDGPAVAVVPRSAANPEDVWILEDDLGNWLAGRETQYTEAMVEGNKSQEENPQKEPFKSKYAARTILKALLVELEAKLEEVEGQPNAVEYIQGTIGTVQMHLGSNYIEAEEVSEGERHLAKAKEYLEPIKLKARFCLSYVKVLSSEGILWANRGEHEKSLLYLQEAESAYKEYTQYCEGKDPKPSPGTCAALLPTGTSDDSWQEFESAHTHALFFLAQCYGHLGQPEKSAEHCHLTLQRQLRFKTYGPLDWAINAAGLSQYYLQVPDYVTSSHCLLCANKIAAEGPSETEEQQEQHANVSRCWIKYTLNVLETSVEYCGEAVPSFPEPDRKLRFAVDDDELDSVPTTLAKTTTEARVLFKLGEKHVQQALKFYTLDGHVTDFVAIQQDYSQLYKNFSVYVDDPDNKCKLHKRRLDALGAAVVDLNQQYFLAVVRQLQFEMGETAHEMMNLKRSKYNDQNPPDAKGTAKINKLGMLSIRWFTEFIDSCRENISREIPETLDELVVRPFLVAKFTVARIYSLILVDNPTTYLSNMKKSQDEYEWVVAYCDKHPDYKGFAEEYELCVEMIRLLPVKMKQEMERAIR